MYQIAYIRPNYAMTATVQYAHSLTVSIEYSLYNTRQTQLE